MIENLIETISKVPVPIILVIGGIVFFLLGLGWRINNLRGIRIEPPPSKWEKLGVIIIGLLWIILGISFILCINVSLVNTLGTTILTLIGGGLLGITFGIDLLTISGSSGKSTSIISRSSGKPTWKIRLCTGIIGALIFILGIRSLLNSASTIPWRGDKIECEEAGEPKIHRSNASEGLVLHFGSTRRDAEYLIKLPHACTIEIPFTEVILPAILPQKNDLFLYVRYSKNSQASVPIEVFVNDEKITSFKPENTGDWNRFCTDTIRLSRVWSGTHSLKFFANGYDEHGIADLDTFILSNYELYDESNPEAKDHFCEEMANR